MMVPFLYSSLNSYIQGRSFFGGSAPLFACAGFRKNDSKPGETRQATYAYDGLGRVTQRTVNAGRATVPTSFTYVSGPYGTGSTTPLVESMTQLTRTLKYTYDNAGNITSVTQGDKTVRYTYDTLGQLIRVDDPNDLTTSFDGTTWVFTYDFGGNILTKKGYAYTTGTVGAIQRSYAYVYGDANWKDKLTAINGDKITSDAIGNPLSDGTWTYKWAKGRQLQSMNKTGTSISYTYNEDGLRVGKNVNGTETSYVLHGKNVVHLTRGGDSLHFYYGADGHPTVVEYNGVSYSYAYNLQGDVISLQDADGWTQVQYAYDAWGQPIGKTGAMANTLGTLNPFRYRGYIYDEETGLYYLRSRYYNPSWGRFINADDRFQVNARWAGNIFMYCNNNPMRYMDHSGCLPTVMDVKMNYSLVGGIFLKLKGYSISKVCYQHFLLGNGEPLEEEWIIKIGKAVSKSSKFIDDIVKNQPKSKKKRMWRHQPEEAIELEGDLFYSLQHIKPESYCFRTDTMIYGVCHFTDVYDFEFRPENDNDNSIKSRFNRFVNNICGYALQENGYGTNYTIDVVFPFVIPLTLK